MTTELTKAAQQALEALRANAIHYGDPLRCSRDAIAALERALTQRPAAQAGEREAFEARVVAEAGEGAIAKWLGTDGYENTRVQDNRLGWVWCLEWQAGRASLPAPQQAAPEPVGEVVYQIKGEAFECPHAWRDATEEAFYTTPAADRRIVYTRPAPGVPEDGALLDFMETHRVAVSPEYEGQWCARQYDDEPQAVAESEAATPRDALRALAAAQAKGGQA